VDPEKVRALSNFYREEFLRHLAHLETCGVLGDTSPGDVGCDCHRLMSGLDDICWREEFPAVAETLLQRFDILTHLSTLAPRKGH
jgi:hypothetical protein